MLLDRIFQVLDDRSRKQAMASADYWDERAKTRSGFARSVWHSETFSQAWDSRQQQLLREALGPVAGLRVADVGCGTGRISRFLAREGATVTGFDFSPTTVEAARAEAEGIKGLSFEVADATSGSLPVAPGTFDIALAVGCLAVACRDRASLGRALSAMAQSTREGGHVALLEPIHDGRLVGRVLREPLEVWVDEADKAGLTIVDRRGMGFLPARLLFSSLDAPSWIVDPLFDAGEKLLDSARPLEATADYRLLIFRKRAA